MSTMNETEQAMLDLVVDGVDRGVVTDLQVSLLLRTVRAYALRDAAKEFTAEHWRHPEDHFMPSVVSNWLLDRADYVECGNGYPEEPASTCGDYPAPCNCDDPETHGGH